MKNVFYFILKTPFTLKIEDGEKAEVSREHLFVNSYHLKTNKTF